MRIATWNVNSLRARLDKLAWWLERARPDVVLLQETKLPDDAAPHAELARLGYALAHHGQGRWNGVAIASRVGLAEVVASFGRPARAAAHDDDGAETEVDPLSEARMLAAVCGGVRVVSLYAPNGREVGTRFYEAKLAWFGALERWLRDHAAPDAPLVLGGDFNVAPADADVWDAAACSGGTHVSPPERAALDRLRAWGLVDLYRQLRPEPERYTWWDYRAGNFHKNLGMRIDLLLGTEPVARRLRWTEIDREARKGKPLPSDHAPLVVDLDEAGPPFDAGWEAAAARRSARAGGAK
jgi:exodeoxyribonuclease-3